MVFRSMFHKVTVKFEIKSTSAEGSLSMPAFIYTNVETSKYMQPIVLLCLEESPVVTQR